jgi:hypothetical protein
MVLLSLRPRAFRTRNSGRDAETDEARLGTISNAISMALADARRERDGLGQRMNMYYSQAAALMDNSAEYGKRDRVDEASIGSAENGAARARQRVVVLDAQIQKLEELLSQVGRTLSSDAVANEGVA